jgi:nitrate reductase molybdenum cofactor assembly chaperone NarJ/NarW
MRGIRRRARPPYKLLSLLLQYPGDELLAARPELAEAVLALPDSAERAEMERFLHHFGRASAIELQRRYVETFDLQRRASLYLTYFTHGDTRKRGMALLRLKRLYTAAGLRLDARELPDFLPLMLEFAALAPAGTGEGVLSEHRAGLELLRVHLRGQDSPYLHLLDAVCAGLSRPALPELETVRRLIREGPPTEEVGLQPFAPPEVMPMEPRR